MTQMEAAMDAGNLALLVCSCISLTFSCFLVVTYCIDYQWRTEFRRVKRMLLAVSLCTLLDSSAAMVKSTRASGFNCKLQANFVELGIISAFLYEAAMSWEMATTTYLMREGRHAQDKQELRRHVAYHVTVLIVVGTIATVVNYYDLIEYSNLHCHFSSGLTQLSLLLPAVFSLFVVIGCNAYTWLNILCMMRLFMPELDGNNALILVPSTGQGMGAGAGAGASAGSTSAVSGTGTGTGSAGAGAANGIGSDSSGGGPLSNARPTTLVGSITLSNMWQMSFRECYATYLRLDSFTQYTVMRVMLTPMLYVTDFVICVVTYAIFPAMVGNVVVLAAVLVLPPINTTLWVLSDTKVRRRWYNLAVFGEYADSPSVGAGGEGSCRESDRESDVEALYASQLRRAGSYIGPTQLWSAIFGGKSTSSSCNVPLVGGSTPSRSVSTCSGAGAGVGLSGLDSSTASHSALHGAYVGSMGANRTTSTANAAASTSASGSGTRTTQQGQGPLDVQSGARVDINGES